MNFPTFLLVTFSPIVWICWKILTSNSRARSKLPPGPNPFQIIGNILDLGSKPHRSLAQLSRKFGPVMSLKLGRATTIVVSSPEAARVVFREHDSAFSGRVVPSATTVLKHNESSIVLLPAGDQWRRLRKLCKEQIFSASKLDAGQGSRREILRKLRDYVKECAETGRAVDVGEAAFTTSLNMISASVLSAEFGSEPAPEIKDLVWGIMECFGNPNLVDLFPLLKSIDPQGIFKQAAICMEKLFAIFDEIIDERLKSRGGKDDLVEALIDLNQRDEPGFSRKEIKHFLLDLFVAGTDTTSATVEWAMTELIRNPLKMSKLRNEVKNFQEESGRGVEESDIPRLPYLQAVVKEIFRLHPAGPFLVPHKANSDVEIDGYIVPKDAHILVNLWAIGRDNRIWKNADEFVPERFLNENDNIDFKGQDFELIPFGAGRRMCPGLPLANRMVQQILVTFVGSFEWKLEMMKPGEIDMNEKFRLTLHKAIPLIPIPTNVSL